MALPLTHNNQGDSDWREANDLYVVSDLHLADGRRAPFGRYAPGENFFWDESFGRFLGHIQRLNDGSKTLVVNGDFIDFLRVDRIPCASDDGALVDRWARFLRTIEHPAAGTDLCRADPSEQEYGFKTQDYKCVWKLMLVFEGHGPFFDALRAFVNSGENRLLIVRGNHDLEFWWEAVRQAFVYFLAGEDAALYDGLNRRITFFQRSLRVNGTVHIEHGDMFDTMATTVPEVLPGHPDELLLPVGSLFNRYVINKIEHLDPLFDNIKPPTSILKAVATQHPKALARIIFRHLVGAWKIVRKSHVRFAARIIRKIFSVGLPLVVFVVLLIVLYVALQQVIADALGRWILNTVVSLLGALAVRWVQSRLMGLESASSLVSFARGIYESDRSLTMVTFGHTHTSEMSLAEDNCWYINSGTWIPHFDTEVRQIQDTDTFCVVRILNAGGMLHREPLLRWNDERGELERMIFLEEDAVAN